MMRPRPEPRVGAFLDSIADEGLGLASMACQLGAHFVSWTRAWRVRSGDRVEVQYRWPSTTH